MFEVPKLTKSTISYVHTDGPTLIIGKIFFQKFEAKLFIIFVVLYTKKGV